MSGADQPIAGRDSADLMGGRHRLVIEQSGRRSAGSLLAALGLTASAAVLPGAAFVLLGRRRLGIAVLAAYAVGLVALVYVLLRQRPGLLRLLVQSSWLTATIVGLVVAFVLLALVIGLSHYMARPRNLGRWEGLSATLFVLVLCAVVAVPFAVGIRYAVAQQAFLSEVFVPAAQSHSPTRPQHVTAADPWHGADRVNVLLIGGDAGPQRVGTRTDSMIVASVDVHTGDVVLFGLPRNLEKVPFPKGTRLHRLYPHGFTGPGDPLEWMLNAVYPNVPALHPGVLGKSDNEGADALKLAASGALHIPIDYYVLVNLSGFVQLVDAMGGVTVNVNEPIPIGGITGVRAPEGYLQPGPNKHLDGYRALWFARGRYGLDDYDRMRRQRCLMSAIIDRADPMTLLTRYTRILDAGRQILQTDIPSELLPAFVDLALKVKDAKIRSLVFAPSAHFNPAEPDFRWIHHQVRKALRGTGGNGHKHHRSRSPLQSPAGACAYRPVQ